MNKTILAGLLLTALLPAARAQTDKQKINVGTVTVDFDKATLNPGLWHLTGHANIMSDDYDLSAAEITITFAPGSKTGASGLRQAVAEGGAVPGAQVIAHIRRVLQSEAYEIYADRAVYLPDRSRPSGGTMKFTGHVKVITKSGFLAEPSVSTFETATVLLGAGSAYPQVQTGPGHITLTPAQ